MNMHTLKRTHAQKKSRQVGRGGTRGKTSGRGTKGQNARAGHKNRPELRDFIKRIPKLRGRGKNINTSIKARPVVVNLSVISKQFKSGEMVNPQTLVAKNIIETKKGMFPQVKLLGSGITFAVTVMDCEVSASAKAAIEKAGGTIK